MNKRDIKLINKLLLIEVSSLEYTQRVQRETIERLEHEAATRDQDNSRLRTANETVSRQAMAELKETNKLLAEARDDSKRARLDLKAAEKELAVAIDELDTMEAKKRAAESKVDEMSLAILERDKLLSATKRKLYAKGQELALAKEKLAERQTEVNLLVAEIGVSDE